jgi:hypothetical protein
MPLSVKEIQGRFRLVEPSGEIAKNENENPVDGGGYSSKKKALAQLTAINMNDAEKTFKPPVSAANAAKKAIEWKEKYREQVKGGTQVGWTRARQLVNRENLTLETVKRMHSFFSRHQGNQNVSEKYRDEPWRDNGYIAWLIWGGDAAKKWASEIVENNREG